MIETSYVMVKPEFSQIPDVVSEVKQRLQNAGLKITDASYIRYTAKEAKEHYSDHIKKDFYPYLEAYITSNYVYGMIVEGENAIAKIRTLVGATKNPKEGTIRYDIPKSLGWELRVTQNVVHASDSVEAAKKEIEIYLSLVDQKTNELCKN